MFLISVCVCVSISLHMHAKRTLCILASEHLLLGENIQNEKQAIKGKIIMHREKNMNMQKQLSQHFAVLKNSTLRNPKCLQEISMALKI